MLKTFPNFWTPAFPVAEIGDTPVALELAGEHLVLFRNASGEIGALFNQCPHRGAALSLGRVTEDGCLECPYHGWQFDRDGSCTQVPFNNPKDVHVQTFCYESADSDYCWVGVGVHRAKQTTRTTTV